MIVIHLKLLCYEMNPLRNTPKNRETRQSDRMTGFLVVIWFNPCNVIFPWHIPHSLLMIELYRTISADYYGTAV
jgi:hypothetical protein